MPRLSIIIPTHRRPASLQRLLHSISRQSFRDFEVLVVENFAEGRTYDHDFPLTVLCANRLGVNSARNLGAANAHGEIFFFLDDDVEIEHENLFAEHMTRHDADPAMHGLGGAYECPDSTSSCGFAYHLIAMAWLHQYREPNGVAPYLIGGHASYKREVFETHSFNPDLKFGGAETELNIRLHLDGKKLVLDPTLTVIHHLSMGAVSLLRKAYLQGKNSKERKSQWGSPAEIISAAKAFAEVRAAEERALTLPVRFYVNAYHRAFRHGWNQTRI